MNRREKIERWNTLLVQFYEETRVLLDDVLKMAPLTDVEEINFEYIEYARDRLFDFVDLGDRLNAKWERTNDERRV